jgi:hypothetical protein
MGTDMCFEMQALTDQVWIYIIMQKLKSGVSKWKK